MNNNELEPATSADLAANQLAAWLTGATLVTASRKGN
jgi:hypothetical protein